MYKIYTIIIIIILFYNNTIAFTHFEETLLINQIKGQTRGQRVIEQYNIRIEKKVDKIKNITKLLNNNFKVLKNTNKNIFNKIDNVYNKTNLLYIQFDLISDKISYIFNLIDDLYLSVILRNCNLNVIHENF